MVTESNKVIQAQNVIIPSITYVELTKTGGFASSVQSTFHKDLNDINSVFAFGSSALASSYEGTNSWSNYGNLGTVAAGEDLVASLYTKNDSYEIVSSSIGSLFLSADSGATWTAELKNVPYVLRHFSENKRFPGLTYNLVVGDNGLVMMHR